jgi:ceramide glucosyltransferase
VWVFVWVFFIVVGFISYAILIFALRSLIKVNFSSSYTPLVSIIKPIKGIDDNLFDNLESFCNLDYPQYELIFSLPSCADPAYKIANKIKLKYLNRDIKIVIDDSLYGLNPKVNNMYKAYMMAKSDIIIISDSNVLVGKDYIKQTVKYLKNNEVSVVTNPIRGTRALSFGALLENLQLNTFVTCGMAFLNTKTHIPCVVGKSIIFSKKDLEEVGGFWFIKNYLAEDFMIGKLIKEKNKKVALSNYFIDNVNEYWDIKKFLNRHSRWAKMRWKIGGAFYISEILANPVFLSFIGLFIFGFSSAALSIFVAVWFFKAALDYYVGYLINADIKVFYYFLSPVKDIIMGIVWFVPFVNTKVYWRGKKYSIGKNTLLVESK